MRSIVAALILLLTIGGPAAAGKLHRNKHCLVSVLRSEELPIAALFYHTVRVTLLVPRAHAAPAETTVYEVIPWQVPPPRQGQRLRVLCNPSAGFF